MFWVFNGSQTSESALIEGGLRLARAVGVMSGGALFLGYLAHPKSRHLANQSFRLCYTHDHSRCTGVSQIPPMASQKMVTQK
jgi:hypothetical protein